MTNALKLLVGFGLMLPGIGLLLRSLKLAPPALEAITTFVVGGVRFAPLIPAAMVVLGGILVGSALLDRPEADRQE